MRKILFVCTGNISRSLIAEYALKKYLKDNRISGYQVSSAGISARPQMMLSKVQESIKSLGFNKIKHKQRKLSSKIVTESDVIIAIAENHVDFISKTFAQNNILLFNELALGKHTSIWDIDKVKNYKTNVKGVENRIEQTANHIISNTPALFQNILDRYFIFEDLSLRKRKHRNGFPFVVVHETKNAIAFLSLDIPRKIGTHVLVIPKKRYVNYHDVPKKIRHELSDSISEIGRALNDTYDGYNILLNDGKSSGQWIYHCHFHLIPRIRKDGIKIELWDRKSISEKEYIALSNKLKNDIIRLKKQASTGI